MEHPSVSASQFRFTEVDRIEGWLSTTSASHCRSTRPLRRSGASHKVRKRMSMGALVGSENVALFIMKVESRAALTTNRQRDSENDGGGNNAWDGNGERFPKTKL